MSKAAAGSEGIEGVCVCACFSERNWVSGCVVYLAVNGAPSLLLFVGAWVGCWWSLGSPTHPFPSPSFVGQCKMQRIPIPTLPTLTARPVPTKAEQSWARQCPMLGQLPPQDPTRPRTHAANSPAAGQRYISHQYQTQLASAVTVPVDLQARVRSGTRTLAGVLGAGPYKVRT